MGLQSVSFQSVTWGTCLFGLRGFVCRCGTRSLYRPSASKRNVSNPTTNEQYKVDFVIVDNDLTPLLSSVAAPKMNLMSVHFDQLKAVNVVTQVSHPYFTQFPDAFKDTRGTLPGKKVLLTTSEGSTPVIRCARTLPEYRK